MVNNIIDVELPGDVEEQAIQLIKNTESLFTFLVALTPEERQQVAKMGKRSLDFVERSLMHAKENRNLIPFYVDLDKFERDCRLVIQLRRILASSENLTAKLKDTYLIVGSEAFTAAREFYGSVKNAAHSGVLGCDSIKKDLAARYKKQQAKEEEPTRASETTEVKNNV